jgi:hypothetical protein
VAVLVVAVLGLASEASAQSGGLAPGLQYNYGEQETPRAAALGGAVRALGNGTTALFANPADLVATRVYHLQALGQIAPESDRQIYGGAIVDSITGRLAGGLAVVGGWVNGSGDELERSLIDVRFALAYPLGDRFFIGLAGRYLKVSQSGIHGPFGDSLVSGGLAEVPGDRSNRSALVNTPTFDAGITIRATDELYLAVLGQNLTYPNNGILPTMLGGAIGYGTKDVTVEVDGVADFTSYAKTTARLMAGGEYLLGDRFPLRVGYRFDQGANSHAASVGLGYLTPEFGVEASVRRTISDPGLTTVVIGLSYFLESSGLTRTPHEL